MLLNPVNARDTGEPKRRKLRSCATCRRQKARCELTSSHDKCHRCDVLHIPCIFDPDAQANRLASTFVQPTSGAQTQIPCRDASIEERLRVIEEALKQILHATGHPSLDSISHELSLIRDPASRRLEAIFSREGSSSAGLHHSSPMPYFGRNGDTMRLFPTPIERGIITLEESYELTAIFEMRYNHCVYMPILKSHRMTLERPFAFTVMCALALRLKTTIPNQGEVRVKIHKLLQDHLSTAMGSRPYTVDAIHGLLLMSLWSSVLTSLPHNEGSTIVPDGWLLLATAVRMAQALRLHHAAAEAQDLYSQGQLESPQYEAALEKAKVWYALITCDLAMSLASSRSRLTNPVPYQSRVILESISASPTDRCLVYHLDALTLAHDLHAFSPPTTVENVPSYVLKVDSIMDSMDLLSSRAYEMSMSYLENPQACLEYRVFRLYQQYCGCVCLIHACSRLGPFARGNHERSNCDETMERDEDQVDICAQLLLWIHRTCEMAEALTNEAFPETSNDSAFLSTAPDHLFTSIAFCAATLIQGQATATQCGTNVLERADEYDRTVERAIRMLKGLNLPDSELPRRYAQGLATMLRFHQENKDGRKRRGNWDADDGRIVNGHGEYSISDGIDLVDESSRVENGYNISPFIDMLALLDPAVWLHEPDL